MQTDVEKNDHNNFTGNLFLRSGSGKKSAGKTSDFVPEKKWYLHLIGASKDLATVTITFVPNTWKVVEGYIV